MTPVGPPQLDHVGVVARDLGQLVRSFSRLGFHLTEPRALMGRDPHTGALRSLGQSSCHAVFGRGYLELSAVETDDPRHHLAAWLPRGPGLWILALGDQDLAARQAWCREAGLDPLALSLAVRDIRYGSRPGEARFEWFMLDADHTPEGLVCFVHNLTPERVYQPEVQQHPNGAGALTAVTLRVGDLQEWTERYRRLLGAEPVARPGRSVFALTQGQSIELDEASAYDDAAVTDGLPRFAGFTVTVTSIAAACTWLDRQGVPYEAGPNRLRIAPDQASGCRVELAAA